MIASSASLNSATATLLFPSNYHSIVFHLDLLLRWYIEMSPGTSQRTALRKYRYGTPPTSPNWPRIRFLFLITPCPPTPRSLIRSTITLYPLERSLLSERYQVKLWITSIKWKTQFALQASEGPSTFQSHIVGQRGCTKKPRNVT